MQLYGYLVQIEHPKPGESLIAKEDVMLQSFCAHPVGLAGATRIVTGIHERFTSMVNC